MENKSKIRYLLLGLGIGIIITNILNSLYPRLEYIELSDEEVIERAKELGMVKVKENIKILEDPIEDNKSEDKIEAEEVIIEKEILIEKGTELTKVAKQLYAADLIDDEEEFIFYVRGKELSGKINYGSYNIRNNLDYSEIIKILTDRNYGKD